VLQALLTRLREAILRRPRRVLWGSAAGAALMLALGSGVEFRTSRSELAPPDDPEEKRFAALVEEFGGASDLIACVEAAPGSGRSADDLRAFSDALSEAFRSDPEAAQVFHRVDLEWLLRRGLYLVPPGEVEAAVAALRGEEPALRTLPTMRGLADLDTAVAARIEADLARPGSLPAGGSARAAIGALTRGLEAERRFLQDPEGALAGLEGMPPLLRLASGRPGLGSRGYLATRDGGTLFLLVSPRTRDDSLPALRRFVGAMRRAADRVVAERPGFRVAFTGEPATTVEEMKAVRHDMWATSIVSAVGVAALTFLVFRWRTHALLVLTALAAGVAWSYGAVRLELGYLNLITSSFLSTLVGVGVAYGIHPVSEYELRGAHMVDPAAAVRAAYHTTGAAVTVGAVTTAAAFFSILLMRFRGFAELGLVAGVGVMLCLVAALVTLPALLLVHGWRRQARESRSSRAAASAAVDRLWVERGAMLICRFPRATTVAALGLTVIFGIAALGVRFDTNILDLLPSGAESVRFQRRMILESDLSPVFNMALAEDLGALRAMQARAGPEPSIERVESILQFLPEDAGRSRAAIADLRGLLDRIRLPPAAGDGRGALAASLKRLEKSLGRASEAAFGAGLGDLAGPLEEARAAAAAARRAATGAGPGAETGWRRGETRLLAWARRALDDAREAAAADPPSVGALPPEVRGRFVTRSGRFVAFLHPAGNVFDPAFLERYVAASRRVDPEVTGFPIVFHRMAGRITSGFHRAAAAAAILVFLILLLDYRNLREAFLALLPLAMGVVWMLGGMRFLGLSFNFANLVAVPLIIGVGIDSGVHVVQRLRHEGEGGMTIVLRHTGRAILIASLTTMIGFGSLALASHRGLSSLGTVLLLGVGACLVTSTVVLPNLLVATGLARR
jgi:hopanoid biosynthesis associated RND transporter like protein HpnN